MTSDKTELQKVIAACRVILDSDNADPIAKGDATKWGEFVRTRQWGSVKARYVGMGKNADGSWYVRVQDFKGQQSDLPYNSLDPASQQVLKDIWQLKFSLLKSAEPIAKQQQADVAKRATDKAALSATRKVNLAAPFPKADKDGYRVWTNVVVDTVVAKIDSFVSRPLAVVRKGKKTYVDGKDESQLEDYEKASLEARIKIAETQGRTGNCGPSDPHVIFLCKDQTKVEWPAYRSRR